MAADLYQEMILDHSRTPRNKGDLEDANRHAEGDNPLCGDHIEVDLRLDDEGRVEDIRFRGNGCAISQASASVMTGIVKGMRRDEAEALFQGFHELITKGTSPDDMDLGKLAVFSGVNRYPARVKCAILAWHTFKAALDGEDTTVSTE